MLIYLKKFRGGELKGERGPKRSPGTGISFPQVKLVAPGRRPLIPPKEVNPEGWAELPFRGTWANFNDSDWNSMRVAARLPRAEVVCAEVALGDHPGGIFSSWHPFPVAIGGIPCGIFVFDRAGQLVAEAATAFEIAPEVVAFGAKLERVKQKRQLATIIFRIGHVPENTVRLQLFFCLLGRDFPQGETLWWSGPKEYEFLANFVFPQSLPQQKGGIILAKLKALDAKGEVLATRERAIVLSKVERQS